MLNNLRRAALLRSQTNYLCQKQQLSPFQTLSYRLFSEETKKPADEAEAALKEASEASAPEVQKEQVKGGHASKKDIATKQLMQQEVSDYKFENKSQQEKLLDSIISKQRSHNEADIEKRSIDTLKDYDQRNRTRNIKETVSPEFFSIKKQVINRKAGPYDIINSEIYQQFEKKLQAKFQGLTQGDLTYLRTQLDAESGKIPYIIAKKLGIQIDQIQENKKVFDLFLAQPKQAPSKQRIPFKEGNSKDILRAQEITRNDLQDQKSKVLEKLDKSQGINTRYDIDQDGVVKFKNDQYLDSSISDLASRNFYYEAQIPLYKNIDTAKKFNFTSATFTEQERDLIVELKKGPNVDRDFLKDFVADKTRINLPELTQYLKYKKAGAEKANNPEFKIAIVDVLLHRVSQIPETLIQRSNLAAFWRQMTQDFPEHPISQLYRARNKQLKEEEKLKLLNRMAATLQTELKSETNTALETAAAVGFQNELKKRQLAFAHKRLRQKVDELQSQKHQLEQSFERLSQTEAVAPQPQVQLLEQTSNPHKSKVIRYHSYQAEKASLTEHNLEIEFFMDKLGQNPSQETQTETFQKVEAVLENMSKRGLEKNLESHIVLFPYALQKQDIGQMNSILREVSAKSDYQALEPVDLKSFFEVSLKNDNYIGLNLLMEYSNKFQIDFKNFDLNAFKPSLDYYMNTEFNLSNICTFLRYYMKIFGSHIMYVNKPTGDSNFSARFAKSQKIFQYSEFIDIRSLFSFLVQKTGQKQLIDQNSGQEVLNNGLIKFFLNNNLHFLQGSTMQKHNFLDEKDIALYFRQHLDHPSAFYNIVEALKSYDQDQIRNYTLHNAIFEHLDEYMAQAKELPKESFGRENLRKEYQQLLQSELKVSEKTAELFLNVFRAQGMYEEIIDLCENWSEVTGQEGTHSEIRKYYLAHALMNMKFQGEKTPYSQMIRETVYTKEHEEFIPKTFAISKALFKEKNDTEAINFFKTEMEKYKQQIREREEALVEEFNKEFKVYSETTEILTFDQFSRKYSQVLGKLKSQSDTGNFLRHLKDITANKEYRQLERISTYYLLISSELQFLRQQAQLNDQDSSQVSLEKAQQYLNTKTSKEEYKNLKDRRVELEKKLDSEDRKKVLQLVEDYDDKTVLNSSRLTPEEYQKASNLSQGVEKEKVNMIEEYRSQIEKARKNENIEFNETDKFFSTYKEHLKNLLEEKDKKVMKSWKLPQYLANRIAPQKPENLLKEGEEQVSAEKVLEGYLKEFAKQNYKVRNMSPEAQQALRNFWEWAYDKEELETSDPEVRKANEQDKTVVFFQDQLIDALRTRQEDVSQEFAKVFDALKDQEFKTRDYSLVENLTKDSQVTKQEIGQVIDQLHELLNHPRSPIRSALQTLPFAEPHKLPENFVQDNFHQENPELNVERLLQEGKTLQDLGQDLSDKLAFAENLQRQLTEEIRNSAQTKSPQRINSTERVEPQFKEQLEAKYEEYKKIMQTQETDLFSREAKLRLMKEVLLLFGQDERGQIEMPAFYCVDLLQFGIKNNLPAAVRLAEDLVSQAGIQLSYNLARALREYKMEFNDQYRDAFDQTGPVDGASLYRNFKLNKVEETGPVSFYTLDDPALTLHYMKNRKRENHHKLPSLFAWDHKRHGMLGEVLDFDLIEKMQKQASRYFI